MLVSHGVMGTSDEESDEDWQEVRGRTRTFSSSTARGTGENGSLQPLPRPVVRRPSSPGASGSDSARLPTPRRTKFTRSRSPAVSAVEDNAARERLAAMIARHQSQKVSHWLPARWRAAVPVPRVGVLAFSVDAKAAAENAVLLISLAGMRRCLGNVIVDVHDVWIQHGTSASTAVLTTDVEPRARAALRHLVYTSAIDALLADALRGGHYPIHCTAPKSPPAILPRSAAAEEGLALRAQGRVRLRVDDRPEELPVRVLLACHVPANDAPAATRTPTASPRF
jgi:hypothetical protein